MGGSKPLTFHGRTSTLTTSWQRQRLFCSQQDYTQVCPFTPASPFVWGVSATYLQLMQDPDIGLIEMAESGVHTGVSEPIRFSGIWRRQRTEMRENPPLGIYDTNWKSAEEDPDTVFRLIQEDIDANFVQEFHDDISQPKMRRPKGVAVGRLSVVRSDQRDPRLRLRKSPSSRAWKTLFHPKWCRIHPKESV